MVPTPGAPNRPTTPGDPVTDLDARRTPVTQRAVEEIKRRLADGSFGPGDRLPTERDLAADLGVSRSSMREAIRALITLGVLESRHGAGVYVTALRPSDLLETFSVLAEVSQGTTLLEVLQVRRMLEPAATALAAARADDAQLAHIGTLLEDIDGEDGTVSADLGFHQAIVAATGNATLAAVNDGLSSESFHARVWTGHRQAGLTVKLREDHHRIHEALLARDPDAARAAATTHVMRVEHWLRAELEASAD